MPHTRDGKSPRAKSRAVAHESSHKASKDANGSRHTRQSDLRDAADDNEVGVRSLWSGTISFGLVSVPVHVLTGSRSTHKTLRMLASDGTPLERRYHCPEHDEDLDWEQIVRGYEIEEGKFVVVTDEELEGLEPRKSRDIELTQFVEYSAIDPIYFERAYFLVPGQGGGHAYQLLTDAMESTGKAGIATFVMRGKEYLVAIVSEKGVLRAETLRFADEVRSTADIGLGKPPALKDSALAPIKDAVRKLIKSELSTSELTDDYSEALEKLASKKAKSQENVVTVPEEATESEGGAQVIDLLEVLKQTLAKEIGTGKSGGSASGRSPPEGHPKRSTSHGHKAAYRETEQSLEALKKRAKSLGIEGRSKMSRRQLLDAIRHAN